MSFGRSLVNLTFGTLSRKVRAAEGTAGQAIANFRTLRRVLFYVGAVYCSGQLFVHWVLDWGVAEGPSMYPTMANKTPFTLVSKLHAHGKNMRTGDIVNFTSPIFRSQPVGKRIVGMPGDYVVHDPHCSPSVGGAPVPGITDWRSNNEIESDVQLRERGEPMMLEVPEGHIYAVGDNMAWSRDSRFFGPVPMALINGKQILHSNGTVKSWSWTTGAQMKRIPKDQEEEYLRGWKRRQTETQKSTVGEAGSDIAGKVD